MHLADRMDLPTPYSARPYRGASDHPAMAAVLGPYRELLGDHELPNVEEMDVAYAHLDNCDTTTDIALIECGDEVVAYSRPHFEDLESGVRDCIAFTPTLPDHVDAVLFRALLAGAERHMQPWASTVAAARHRTYAGHPGPGERPTGEAAWLEDLGYQATEWEASLVRPHLDDIPERSLPDGVEVRPATPDQFRTIWEAENEAFRGEWDSHEATEDRFAEFVEQPTLDPTLWKIAWSGDTVVGQVKSYINHDENAARGYLRGYTEDISTHRDWRNRGVAGALLAMSLRAVKDRGMTEAALGVDTNNPGGAFQLYTALGFELRSYGAVYTKPVS